MDTKEIRVRIMCEAYDLADRGDTEGYNSVKVMCSDVLALINKYTAPPKREWVGLTDEEIEECKIDGGLPHTVNWRLSAKVMQAKLKEKNT